MRILVCGAHRVDAGKTTFSTGLVHRLGAVGWKPRAGNDYWFDHDDVLAAVSDGRLHGKDAARLVGASPGDRTPEDVNPIHRLWRPSPGPAEGILGQQRREFVVDRIGADFVVNGTVDIPPAVAGGLSIDDATVVETLSELNAIMEATHLPALTALRDRIADCDPAVVESYGDVARPIRDLQFDAVAVVEPRRMRAYPGERFGRAVAVAGGSGVEGGGLETRAGEVTDLLEPQATVSLPALPGDVQSDPTAVAEADAAAYDALLELA